MKRLSDEEKARLQSKIQQSKTERTQRVVENVSDTEGISKSQKKRRVFFASICLAFDIMVGSFRLLKLHPGLITPLLPVFFMIIGLMFGLLFIENLYVVLGLIFVVAYCLMFSFAISSRMLQQIHEGQKPSLGKAITSPSTMRMIPAVFLLSLIWYTLVLILVVIETAIKTLVSRSESMVEAVEGIFDTFADALRMMAFMLIPIMIFEDVGLGKGYQRLKSTLKGSPISALSGLALTKMASSLIFLIVVVTFEVVESVSILGFMIGVAVLGMGWMLSMYLEQLFATGLYLYATVPESPLVKILLQKHIGRDLPRVPVPEMAGQPVASLTS